MRVDYCDVFISCLVSHSDGTHSLQRIKLLNLMQRLKFVQHNTNTDFRQHEGEQIIKLKFLCVHYAFKWKKKKSKYSSVVFKFKQCILVYSAF